MRIKLYQVTFFMILSSNLGFSQDVYFKIGIKDSIQSEVLNENRQLTINLPRGYDTSSIAYPTLYVLDGNNSGLLDAIEATHELKAEFIIVAIPNTDRDRDMMPLSTPTYEVDNPGAEKFLSFIGDELIPYVEKNYRSNGQRTIRGRSLSGLFVMYAFLERPELFDNYIGNSAGWYADMDAFFKALIDLAFNNQDQYNGKKMFIANSLVDPFDPKKEVHHAMLEFTETIKVELGDRISFSYKTYDTYGHVPFPSFYDGLKYIIYVSD